MRPRTSSSSSITTIMRGWRSAIGPQGYATFALHARPGPRLAPPHRDPEERGRGLPPPRLPRRQRRRDRGRAPHDEGQPLLLLPQQGGDPLLLPRLLARHPPRPAEGGGGRGPLSRGE